MYRLDVTLSFRIGASQMTWLWCHVLPLNGLMGIILISWMDWPNLKAMLLIYQSVYLLTLPCVREAWVNDCKSDFRYKLLKWVSTEQLSSPLDMGWGWGCLCTVIECTGSFQNSLKTSARVLFLHFVPFLLPCDWLFCHHERKLKAIHRNRPACASSASARNEW